ncbi:MAG: TonB-dependent receptor [Anaerolineae bacterium]|nr:TonB-dependent receptor [Gloeobacterales cyanobacterium ES-bin-313]
MFHHQKACLLLAGSLFLLPTTSSSAQVVATGPQVAPYLRELAPISTNAGQLAQTVPSLQANPDELDEVTVTRDRNQSRITTSATGIQTPARDVPFSVQTIPRAVIREQDPISFQDVLRNVSGINASTRANYGFIDNFYIRGFQAEFLRDGVPDAITPINTERSGLFRGFADVERIEVLKGPAGALYGLASSGDNAGAGLVNLITRPFTEKAESEATFSFGSFGRRAGQLNTGGASPDGKLLYRLDLGYEEREGYRSQSLYRLEILPSFQWRIDPKNTLTFDFDYRRINAEPDIPGIPFLPGSNGAIATGERLYRTPFAKADQEYYRVGLIYDLKIADAVSFTNKFFYTRRSLDLIRNATDVIAYNVTPSAEFPSGIALARRLREQFDIDEAFLNRSEFTFDTRFFGADHRILTGFEYSKINGDTLRYQSGSIGSTSQSNDPTNPLNGNAVCADGARNIDTRRVPCIDLFNVVFRESPVARVQANINENRFSVNETFAVYLQDQITFSEQWKALVGLRFDSFREAQIRRAEGSTPIRSYDRTVAKLNPRIGIVYQPDLNNAIYASFASSFSSNGAAVVNNVLAPLPLASSEQYEVGYKGSFFGNRLNLTVALFNTNRVNVVSRLDVNNNPTDPVDQRSRGIELDLIARPVPEWTFNVNYAFLDAVTTRGVPLSLDGNIGILSPARSDTQITGVPRHSLNLWTTYQVAPQWKVGLGFNFQDTRFANQDGTGLLPSYASLDGLISYTNDNYEIQLNLRNLTDSDYYASGGRGSARLGEPLSAYGTIRYRF